MTTEDRTWDVSMAFSVPEHFQDDPFEMREQIANLMKEAGWPAYHSAGFGCGFGDMAWEVKADELELVNSLAILIDRVGKDMSSLKVQQVQPMTEEEIAKSKERDEKIAALRKAGELQAWFEKDTEERMDAAYARTMSYKPTMDLTMLHAWAQDMIEAITGEFKMEEHL